MRLRFKIITAAGLLTAASLAMACGGGEPGGEAPDANEAVTPVQPARTITLQAKDVKFLPDKLTIAAGSVVEIKLENLDGSEHDFQVQGLDASIISGGTMNAAHGGAMVAVHTQGNETGSVTFTASKKGTYDFNCTILGHKELGMVGTLTVE